MAENTTTTTTTTTTATPAKRDEHRPQACRAQDRGRSQEHRRAQAAAPRVPRAARRHAKAPSKSTGRRSRTIAANETREAATANVRAAKTTAKQGRNVAERAALVYVGATLEARDRAVALVSDLRDVTTTRKGAEKQISKLERRGNTARNQLERDVRKARTRLERELRGRRRDAERLVRRNRARAEREGVARVETVVQAGVSAGERIASSARERVAAIA